MLLDLENTIAQVDALKKYDMGELVVIASDQDGNQVCNAVSLESYEKNSESYDISFLGVYQNNCVVLWT